MITTSSQADLRPGWPWRHPGATLTLTLAALLLLAPPSATRAAESRGRSGQRTEAVKHLCERLGIGKGKVVADIGCGRGGDTMTFAEIVGPQGTVLAEEISKDNLETVLNVSQERHLGQVVPILGHTEDPRLPNGLADLEYMHFVFHHFAEPRQMLEHLWYDLKPGGAMVIIDQKKGPLRDWVETEERESHHHWTGETTVVRLAREAGFRFDGVAEDGWFETDPFVLVFRKPNDLAQPAGDPDLPLPLDAAACVDALPLPAVDPARIAFIGLDRGRALLPVLQNRQKPAVRITEVVLEEWAITKEEILQADAGAVQQVLRTVNGDLPTLTNRTFNAVIFADAYDRLWEPDKLLARLRQALVPDGFVAVIDRTGPADESRRLAGHHRRISPKQVRDDMKEAGFKEVQELKPPAKDRCFLIFRDRDT